MSCEDDNIYADASYTNNAVFFRSASGALPPDPIQTTNQLPKKRSYKKVWRIATVVLGVITIGLLGGVIALVVMQSSNDLKNEDTSPGASLQTGNDATAPGNDATLSGSDATEPTDTPGNQPTGECNRECLPTPTVKSCNDIKDKSSGIYTIRSDANSAAYETYCDMTTDGGGWTLVASIHESDISRKCYSDDLWSSYVPEDQKTLSGKTNWDNEMIFGDVHKSTEADFKNAAYFTMNASDVMLVHVQSGFHIELTGRRPTLRYRTTNRFLRNYGGNMKTLFSKYFPLNVKTGEEKTHLKVLNALVAKSSVIKSQISNWHDYSVSRGSININNQMFYSYGNRIYFRTPRRSIGYLNYGIEYSWISSLTKVNTAVSSPFILIGTVRNDDRSTEYFQIEVYSRRRYPDTITLFENTTTSGNYKLHYRAVQLFNPSYSSPCKFYFTVTNVQDWGSVEPSSFAYNPSIYSSYRYIRMQLNGQPAKLIFGYILLASEIGHNVTADELNNVAKTILETISALPNVFRAPSNDDTLVVPVTFDVGNAEDVLNAVPPTYRPLVEAGYLQFRAYNYTGYPNAICPGIKVNTISPEYVCIGGISGDIEPYGTCGDFAGWGGKSSDDILVSQPTGSAHSQKDLLSTILIFYR